MGGVETDGDSPEGTTALPTPAASLASQVQDPSLHLATLLYMHGVAESGWPRRERWERIKRYKG